MTFFVFVRVVVPSHGVKVKELCRFFASQFSIAELKDFNARWSLGYCLFNQREKVCLESFLALICDQSSAKAHQRVPSSGDSMVEA